MIVGRWRSMCTPWFHATTSHWSREELAVVRFDSVDPYWCDLLHRKRLPHPLTVTINPEREGGSQRAIDRSRADENVDLPCDCHRSLRYSIRIPFESVCPHWHWCDLEVWRNLRWNCLSLCATRWTIDSSSDDNSTLHQLGERTAHLEDVVSNEQWDSRCLMFAVESRRDGECKYPPSD